MKKLLYIYIIGVALAMVGCTKDADIEVDSTNTPASFTLAELTRAAAADVKTDWALGDKVAIFEAGDQLNAKCYEVSDLTTRTLTPSDKDDFFYDISGNTYCAFYPYVAGMTYSEYSDDLLSNFDSTDRLTSGAFSESKTLTFSHSYALLSFNIVAGGEFTSDFTSVTATLTLGDSVIEGVAATIDGKTATLKLFVTPLDAEEYAAVTTKTLSLTGTDDIETIASNFDLNANSEITQYEAGTQYNYNDLILGTFDIYYTGEVYQIYSAKGLKAFADLVNKYSNTADATCGGDGFASFSSDSNTSISGKLMANIDLSSVCGSGVGSWIPIGYSSGYYYCGTFDGNGKKISNLYVNNNTSAGLFGYIKGATIKNLGVSGSVTTSGYNAGGIVGYGSPSTTSTIINCYNECAVTYSGSGSNIGAGGIAGSINATIINCYNTGAITGYQCNGGIVGSFSSSSISITNCYNTGVVSGSSSDVQYTSGIAGVDYSNKITNCYYLTGTASQGVNSDSSGITTEMTAAEMQDYTFLTTLRGNATTYNDTATDKACGWILGTNSPTLDFGVEPTTYDIELSNDRYYISSGKGMAAFRDLVNSGDNTQSATHNGIDFPGVVQLNIDGVLTADIDITLDGDDWSPIGGATYMYNGEFDGRGYTISGLSIDNAKSKQGLFSYLDTNGVIANLTVEGDNSSQTTYDVDSHTDSNAASEVGGIVAWNMGLIINCCNRADISGDYNVGGIAGHNSGGDIINCANHGTIHAHTNNAGGIVGNNEGYVANSYCSPTTVTADTSKAGDIVGWNKSSGTVSYGYYGLSHTAIGDDDNSSATIAEEIADMQASDFATTLNATVTAYNTPLSENAPYKACMWNAAVGEGYPTHNFGIYEPAN